MALAGGTGEIRGRRADSDNKLTLFLLKLEANGRIVSRLVRWVEQTRLRIYRTVCCKIYTQIGSNTAKNEIEKQQ